jgi:hypothetical protein
MGNTSDDRVTAGSPATSLLWQKVWTNPDGGSPPPPPCGHQMPYNTEDGGIVSANPLTPADEGKVKSWIVNGALNN